MTHGSPSPLALTMGDPAGCGPQITAEAWRRRHDTTLPAFCFIGSAETLAAYAPVVPIDTPEAAPAAFHQGIPVIDTGSLPNKITPGEPQASAAPQIIGSIERAVSLCWTGAVSGVVTNPINKALLYGAGFAHPGHTEFIAGLCGGTERPVMMLVGGGLRVALATIHMPLTEVAGALTTTGLIELGEIVARDLRDKFGLSSPRLVFTGLNPHAGEDGTIGREEIDIINPAAEALRARGVDMADARSADTVFAEALSGAYDAVIAMTHDQGLIPVKTLDFWGGVNTTLGLPIIRTSPDHGTAYEAAATADVRPDSLIAALKLAGEMAARRAEMTSV